MGNNYAKEVRYTCLNDCRQEGCPGHVLRFGYSRSSDVEFVEIDGKIEYYFDANVLKALIESMASLPASSRSRRQYETKINVSVDASVHRECGECVRQQCWKDILSLLAKVSTALSALEEGLNVIGKSCA